MNKKRYAQYMYISTDYFFAFANPDTRNKKTCKKINKKVNTSL